MLMNEARRDDVHIHDPAVVVADPALATGDLNSRYDVLKSTMPSVTIMLKPVAGPMALGLAAFFSGTWVIASWYTAWYGGDNTNVFIAPFILLFAGAAQFFAGLFCYPARDNAGTVFNCTWGAFFIAYGVYNILISQGAVRQWGRYQGNDELAMWLVTMSCIDFASFFVMRGRDAILTLGLFLHWVGTVCLFGGLFAGQRAGGPGTAKAGGYLWLASALCCLYRSLVWLVSENWTSSMLPTFNTPYEKAQPRVRVPIGEPGVKKGQ